MTGPKWLADVNAISTNLERAVEELRKIAGLLQEEPLERIARLELRPEDVLLIQVPDLADPKRILSVRDQILRGIPDGVNVLVLDGAFGLQVLRPERPGKTAEVLWSCLCGHRVGGDSCPVCGETRK